MVKQTIGINGRVDYVLRGPNGEIKLERKNVPNLITNAGLAEIATLILADDPDSGTAFDYIALGSGSGQTASSTTLATEITTNGGARRGGANATGTTVTTSVTDDTAQLVTTFSFTGTLAITESGVFNAGASGDMLCYQDFSVINVGNGDSLQITWKIQFS